MRTWTLSEKRQPWTGTVEPRVKPENECSFTDEQLTRVVELDPVLDLLEGWWKQERQQSVMEGTSALLKAHGRLGGQP